MDPFALLGVSPDATPEELTRAYRRLAKEWHPDRLATSEAAWRMAQINAAYDAARAHAERGPGPTGEPVVRRRRARMAGAWLAPSTRRAMGAELLRALQEGEPVRLVATAATWASPQARLVVTDRRLLWLLEDAVADRVRSLRLRDVVALESRLTWPRRRTATVRLRDALGRRLSFSELAPDDAAQLVSLVRGRRAA